MKDFNLQFDPSLIPSLAAKFQYDKDESDITEKLKPSVERKGYLTLDELKTICKWKTDRSKSRVATNLAADVEECTRVCFSATNERLRIGSLCLLTGVEYPTASVILHFLHPDPYPILDFRALESLGVKKPGIYSFDFWWLYVQATRKIATENLVDMRILDKALWQWSKG